jgi:hypothetical protein
MKGHKSVLLSPALLAFAAMFMILLSCTCPSGGIVVPTATPVPPPTEPGGEGPVTVSLTFTADRTSIQPGECATLTWDVEGSGQFWVELNGESVSPNSYRQVCPPQTTTYRLIAGTGAALRQELKRGEITIVVSGGGPGPTPTTKPAPTPTTKPAPTPTTKPAPPSVTINFWADSTNLTAGNCTTLHWDVEHATAVYLNGAGVAGHATQQVCPPSTATYTLHVEYAGGATDRQITINVTAPARSFTFSPKSGPAGSEVHLYLSVPANQLVVYFAGRMLPKQMSPATPAAAATSSCSGTGRT